MVYIKIGKQSIKKLLRQSNVRKFKSLIEPYVMKYETQYKVLYQILRQAIGERNKVPSSRVSSTGLTPSLVALEDTSTLK